LRPLPGQLHILHDALGKSELCESEENEPEPKVGLLRMPEARRLPIEGRFAKPKGVLEVLDLHGAIRVDSSVEGD